LLWSKKALLNRPQSNVLQLNTEDPIKATYGDMLLFAFIWITWG
jgi:hypothetical protein